jgi:predicted Zn-dependent protease
VKKNTAGALTAAAAELMSHARDGDLQMLAQAADLLFRARRKDAADQCIEKLRSAMDLGLKTHVADALGGWMDALKGMQAWINERPYTAIAHLENADRRLPSNPRIKTMLAQALAEIDALDSAAGLYRRVISLPGDDIDARLALAWIELARGRTTAAREIIGAMFGASGLSPTDPSGMDGAPPRWHQAQAYQADVIRITCDLLQAGQEGRNSVELDPGTPGQAALARLSENAPSDAPTVKLVANCLLLTGQRERAVNLLRTRMRSSREGAALGTELGRILLRRHPQEAAPQDKAVDAATVLADELVERFPHSVAGYELHVRVLAGTRRLPDAHKYVLESATSDDVKGRLWEVLAGLYMQEDQKEPAIGALRDAVSLLPDDMGVRRKLARLTPRLDAGLALTEAMRTIEGDFGLSWKYERAGVLLRNDPSDRATEEATELLEVCLVERPYWVSAQLLLGDAHRRAGRLEEAADSYRAAIAQRAGLATRAVALKLVRTLQELDRFAEADAVLDTLAKAHPDAPEILRLLTRQLYRNRDMQSAAATAERLLQMEPDDASWGALTADLNRRAGNLVRAEEIARAVLRDSPGATSALWSLAQALIAQKRIDEAEATVRDSVEDHDDPRHWLLLARLLAQTGKRGQAETILARTTELTSVDARVLTAAADIARLLGNRGTQLALLRRAIEQQGEDPGRSLALAEAFMAEGSYQQRDEAAAIVQRRLADDPDDPRALIFQGQLAMSADSPDLAQAELSLTRSLSIEPGSAKAHKLLAAVQLRLGRPEEAHDTVSAGLAVAPHDPDLLLAAAQIYVSLGDHAQAVILLKQVLELRPRAPQALKLFAAASINSGQVDRAIRFLKTHAPQDTRSPTEVAIAARLQEAKENFDLAETLFSRAAAMDQDSSELHRSLLHFLARRNKFDDIHTLASERRERLPHDVESLASAAQILGARSDDSRVREVGLGWLDAIARDHPARAADATYRSALCYYATGEMGRAESKFLESLRLASDAPNVVNDLAWLYSEHMERPDMAVALIERFLSGGGVADAHMLDTHGVALLRLDRFDDAKSKLAACLRLAGRTPTRTAASYHLGQTFLRTGQTQEAMSYIRDALYLDGLKGGLSRTEREEARRLMESDASPTPPASAKPDVSAD